DLAMRRPGADPQVVVGVDDAVEPADRLEVDEDAGLTEPELQERDQAVPAGEELRLAFSLVEDPDRLVEARRTYILEGSRNHRATVLLHRIRGVWARGFRAGIGGDDRAVGRTSRQGSGAGRPGAPLGNARQ